MEKIRALVNQWCSISDSCDVVYGTASLRLHKKHIQVCRRLMACEPRAEWWQTALSVAIHEYNVALARQ